MLRGTLVCNVMREVSAIPQHDILAENRLTVYPFADLGICVDAGRHVKPVVDLVAMVTENPNIPGAPNGQSGCWVATPSSGLGTIS